MSDSPYEEPNVRLFGRRTREIRQEGGASAWFPSTLKQNPTQLHVDNKDSTQRTSPEQQAFASQPNVALADSPYRRARAGTVPSSFGASPSGSDAVSSPFAPHRESMRSGTSSPYRSDDVLGALPALRLSENSSPSARLRAGSLTLPQNRSAYSSAFGPSIFSTSWAQRINSQIPSSPAQSSFSRHDDEQTPIKTLDYLGLAESTPPRNMMDMLNMSSPPSSFTPEHSSRRDPNRIRSYSVNNKEQYDTEAEFEDDRHQPATEYQFNDFYRASPARPRSRTAGVLDSPSAQRGNKYIPMHSHMETTVTAADLESHVAREEQYSHVDAQRADSFPQENYDDSHGMGGYIQSQPTRALWLGNIPSSTPSAALLGMFSAFGAIESARVLTHKSCAFVNFDVLESAILARTAFNGKELFPGAGPVRIGFAKAPSTLASATPEPYTYLDTASTQDEQIQNSRPPTVSSMRGELLELSSRLGSSREELVQVEEIIEHSAAAAMIYSEVPVLPDTAGVRRFDAPRLRELRKRIDNGGWTQQEIEDIAVEMDDEVAELASDYLGNTVVQKLFEICSQPVRLRMLAHICPILAEIGVHKNGTWAAQKIIDTAVTPEEMSQVVEALRPYLPGLFLDQFGNYVVQCCLKFGSTYNNSIYEAMLSHTWEIAQGRYGARAMRACLESHHASKAQQRVLAAVIMIHSVQLAANSNGALLLTWLLDTCMLPNRFKLLAPKLVNHLVHLCNPKLASLTLLKVINQRQEPEARQIILQGLFFSEHDKVLEAVLTSQAQGPGLVFKIITTPYLDGEFRDRIVMRIREVLLRLKVQPVNGSKRLMEEVGLPTRGMVPTSNDPMIKRAYSPSYPSGPYQSTYDPTLPRSTSGIDPASLHALADMSINNHNQTNYALANNNHIQQLHPMQYQAMLQQQNIRPQHQSQYGYAQPYHDPYMNNNMYANNVYAQGYPQQYPNPSAQRRR